MSAHVGSVLCMCWSHDCSSLLTTGEDGHVKIWSRSGSMRVLLHSVAVPVYKGCWSPNDDRVLFSSGKSLVIKSVDAAGKPLQWDAHGGLICALDWSAASDVIVSAGEDARFRIWDALGKELHCSRKFEHTITSASFSPSGEYLVLGTFSAIVLCDKSGWIHCICRVDIGSILDLAWSTDGTEVAGGGTNGSLLRAYLAGQCVETAEFEVSAVERQRVCVRSLTADNVEELIIGKDHVVTLDANDEWLVVATLSQCYIYNFSNLNTPFIIDLKAPPLLVQVSKTHFVLADAVDGLRVHSFEGKVLSSPRHPRVRVETIGKSHLSLVSSHIAAVDSFDKATVYVFDAQTGREVSLYEHPCPLRCVQLIEPRSGFQEPSRLLATVLDLSADLSLLSISLRGGIKGGEVASVHKLHANVDSFLVNAQIGCVTCVADRVLKVWHCPWVAFQDKELMDATVSISDLSSVGSGFALVSYVGHRIRLRGSDGAALYREIPPKFTLLQQLCRDGLWREAVMLCRNEQDHALWSSLAAVSVARKQLDVAEIAFCEVSDVAKVCSITSFSLHS